MILLTLQRQNERAKYGLLQYLEKDDLLTPLQVAGLFLA